MFENSNQPSAGCRVRESKIRLYVAGRRVNVLLASSGCAPHCTRRPAPGVLLLGFRTREDFHVDLFILNWRFLMQLVDILRLIRLKFRPKIWQ
jgi:hypothetical protein